MGKFRGIVLVLAIAGTVLSCAKDRTLDDYQDEETLNNIAKYQAVAGRYSGAVSNKADGRNLGGLELVLQARIKSSVAAGNGSGGSSAPSGVGRAVLVTELHFKDSQYVSMAATSGYYDPDSGIYSAEFKIMRANGVTENTVVVTGNISNGHLTGSLQGEGFQKQSAIFDLKLNGSNLDDLSKAAKPVPGGLGQGMRVQYPAKLVYDVGDPKGGRDIYMNAVYTVATGLEHFVEVFIPEEDKSLQIDIQFGPQTDPIFPQARWNTNTGDVNASFTFTNTGGQTVIQQLRCQNFFFAETRSKFTCDFWTNVSPLFHITFHPAVP